MYAATFNVNSKAGRQYEEQRLTVTIKQKSFVIKTILYPKATIGQASEKAIYKL